MDVAPMLLFAALVGGQPADEAAGRLVAQKACAACHAVGAADSASPSRAPPFRDVMTRYPPEDLDEALAEGMLVGHSPMPQVQLDEADRRALIAYLRTLRRPGR
jgi:cytochrome c